jgi:long-chain acyl-CoA synthetase
VLDLERERPASVAGNGRSALGELFSELHARFVPHAVDRPVSYYISVGDDADDKWTIEIEGERCMVSPGRPRAGKADCVLKTTPEIFTKIVRESYTPSVAEFMSGKVKSNDIALLQTFQKIFDL